MCTFTQYLLGAASNAKRRGIATHDQAPGTLGRNCDAMQDVDIDQLTRRVLYCQKGDWVTIKYTVPLRIVSGSEVLWAVSVRAYAGVTIFLSRSQYHGRLCAKSLSQPRTTIEKTLNFSESSRLTCGRNLRKSLNVLCLGGCCSPCLPSRH